MFFWRKRWDSNPRAREGYLISSQARYDHFDTPPCVFFARFFLFFAAGSKTPSERTDGKNYGIFNFRAREKPHGYGLCAIRNAQSQRRFRVRPVMTTSIRFRVINLYLRRRSQTSPLRFAPALYIRGRFRDHELFYLIPRRLSSVFAFFRARAGRFFA